LREKRPPGLSGSPWNLPETVAGFAQSPPNAVLMRFASRVGTLRGRAGARSRLRRRAERDPAGSSGLECRWHRPAAADAPRRRAARPREVVDGVGTLRIAGKDVLAREGEIVVMPVNVPHVVYANERFKMLLMIRS
jgi:hypothetical protein